MKQNFFKIFLMSMTLMSVSCSQDDSSVGDDTLTYGEYPLLIASATVANCDGETRVSESSATQSIWTANDKISVRIGSGSTGTYTYNGNTFTSTSPLYWENKTGATVTAWYPAAAYSSSYTDMDISDQSSGLKYVLKSSDYGSYKNSVSLSFTNQLAKLRVKLEKGSSYTGALDVDYVKVRHYTLCPVKNGDVGNGKTTGYITMYKNDGYYEANLCPGTLSETEALEIKVDGTTKKVDLVNSKGGFMLAPGNVQMITVTLNEKFTEVNVSSISGSTYTVNGNIHLVGDGNAKNLFITVEKGSKLILDNVNLKPTTAGSVITCNGDATVYFSGTNTLLGKSDNNNNGHAIAIKSGTLTVNGDGTLKAGGQSGNYGGGIYATDGANIVIKGGTIIASSESHDPSCGPAAIGVEGGGNITITGGNITANGGTDAAGIGSGMYGVECGDIYISGDNTVITVTRKTSNAIRYPDYIGKSTDGGSCGTVTIKAGVTVNGTKYESDRIGVIN